MPIVRNPSIATALIQDRKAANTNGGTFSSGGWRTRDLTSILYSSIQEISIASNTISIPAGKYTIFVEAPAYGVNRHQARLFNTTSNVVARDTNNNEIYSNRGHASSSSGSHDILKIFTQLSLSSTTSFRIEHYCQTTINGNGFGIGDTLVIDTPSIFTQVFIWKI